MDKRYGSQITQRVRPTLEARDLAASMRRLPCHARYPTLLVRPRTSSLFLQHARPAWRCQRTSAAQVFPPLAPTLERQGLHSSRRGCAPRAPCHRRARRAAAPHRRLLAVYQVSSDARVSRRARPPRRSASEEVDARMREVLTLASRRVPDEVQVPFESALQPERARRCLRTRLAQWSPTARTIRARHSA